MGDPPKERHFGKPAKPARDNPEGERSVSGRIVGLDIGSTGLRAVQISHTKNGPVIERVGMINYAPGPVVNGQIEDQDAVVECLEELWKTAKFNTKDVVIGLSNSGVITRQMDLPWMPPADFRKALKYQISEALPVSVDTVNLDYHPLGEYEVSDEHGAITEMIRILLVAANLEVVDSFGETLIDAGLRPMHANTIPFSLIRLACEGNVGDPESQVEAVIDLGADVLNIIVHQGGQPRFVRTISNYGGNIVTKALMDKFTLTFDEAEGNKRRVGLTGPAPMVAAIGESTVFGGLPTMAKAPSIDPLSQATLSVVNPWSASLVAEVRNSLDYFLSAYPGASLSSVRVAGGGTYLEGLLPRLNAELRVPVTPLDPFSIVPVKKESILEEYAHVSCSLAVAVGLAMGGNQKHG